MLFDLKKKKQFQQILKSMKESHGLSVEKALHAVDRRPGKWGDVTPLERWTLQRFIARGRTDNVAGLGVLWEALAEDDYYGSAFSQVSGDHNQPGAEAALADALNQVFSRAPTSRRLHDITIDRTRLAGRYIMYRPSTRAGLRTGRVMRSFFEIKDIESDLCVFETQGHQKDAGHLFTYGKFVYFLLREQGDGLTVKFGGISLTAPTTGSVPVKFFEGVVYVTSNYGLYPAARFFCERLGDDEEITDFDSIEHAEIPNALARKYLKDSLEPEI